MANALADILAQRLADQRLRTLRSTYPLGGMKVACDGRTLINFSSNDYLGLSQHPLLKNRSIEWTERYGTGCGASRLITGNLDIYEELEAKLSRLKGTQAALIMNSGYQANMSVIAAVASASAFVLCDRFSHNSLLQGAILSGAKWSRFRHNDVGDLRRRLQSRRAAACDWRWIITESIFSMDGDRADLAGLIAVARENAAGLFVDEAHSTGVFGPHGMGLAAGKPEIDVIMGTFGKACGSFGAYIACSKTMRDYLINFCGGFIYSTGLPPSVLGAIDAALDLIPGMDAERVRLLSVAQHVRSELQQLGYSTGASSTQIIPVLIGDDDQALALSQYLEEHGILALAIRPPTVPEGAARIRLSLSSAHSDEQIEQLVQAFKAWRKRGC